MFHTGRPIETFSLALPESPDFDRESNVAHCYDLQELDDLMATIRHGLGSPCFSRIVDIGIALPSPWYVGRFASAID